MVWRPHLAINTKFVSTSKQTWLVHPALSLTVDPLSRQATSVARASILSASASSTSRLDSELLATLARRKQDDGLFAIMMELCNHPDVAVRCPNGAILGSWNPHVALEALHNKIGTGVIGAVPVDPRPMGNCCWLVSIDRKLLLIKFKVCKINPEHPNHGNRHEEYHVI